MTDREDAQQMLKRALADENADFRDGQWEAIDAIVNQRRKLLVVQRTGWGKSAVYFLATRMLRDRDAGPTLIVSPLLALMRNQVDAARRLGIHAITINSTNADDWPALEQSLLAGEVDAVLVSPERLANDSFVNNVLLPLAQKVGLLVVDEAHCISDWGHDFRPDYRRLINILRRMPANLPILGTTATANDRVIEDITSQLGDIDVQRGPLMRDSLALQTMRLPDQSARLAWLAEQVPMMSGTGIIYVLTKRDAEQVTQWLRDNGIEARAYYSGVLGDGFESSDDYRQHLEGLLLANQLKVLVATTALAMGYDKPDLGFVIHYQAPSSAISYYQQVGRAGRNIESALGVLLAGEEDAQIQEYFRRSAFPSEEHVNNILEVLAANDGLSVADIGERINLRQGEIKAVLSLLSVENPSPVIKDGSNWRRTAVPYRMDHDHIRYLTGRREQEWQEIQDYIDTTDCKMHFLAKSLDDPSPSACGRCSSCLGAPVIEAGFSHPTAVAAARFLKHSEFPLELKVQVANGAFPQYGFRGNLPPVLRAQPGRILARWGDAGWGRQVADGKHAGRFGDDLVEAMAEMIQQRWQPDPRPAWVTCIPSRNHPELVPDFSRRLAQRLGLPFVAAISKLRDNPAQKLQQNRFHQCRNLDGVFQVAADLPEGPVLLIDDMVDSAWTLTVAAALLRQAGCDTVWPVALAATSPGD